jgi:acyl carrier protein
MTGGSGRHPGGEHEGERSAMGDEEIEILVRRALARIAPESADRPLGRETHFRDQFDFDSMDFLTFVIELHERTGLGIPEDDYPQLASLGGCVRYLQERLASR